MTFFFENCAVYEIMWKNIVESGRPHDNMAHVHAGYLRLQTHTHNMWHVLLSYCNGGCSNAPECYIIRTLPVLFRGTRVLIYHNARSELRGNILGFVWIW